MEKENIEKIKLSVKEILLSLVDASLDIVKAGYKLYPETYKQISKYQKSRQLDKNHYYKKLWQLEKQGYIKRYQQEKENIVKLTPLGQKKALKYLSDDFKIKIPKTWDKKWRIVIFDIPEKKQNLRRIVRNKLKKIGFYQLQKSVWVHPFDCQEIIASLKYIYSLGYYLQYIIAESIETEVDLVSYFYEQKILTRKH